MTNPEDERSTTTEFIIAGNDSVFQNHDKEQGEASFTNGINKLTSNENGRKQKEITGDQAPAKIWKKISILKKLILFSFFILACVGFIGYSIYYSRQKLLDSEQMVRHTEQVISLSASVLSLAKDIETASRGFVITNDSAYLDPLFTAEKTAFDFIRQLKLLTSDNPSQQKLVDWLNFYLHKRLDFSLQTVEIRSKQSLASAIAYASNEQGKRYMDHIRQITIAIQQQEGTLLAQRKESNEHSAVMFTRISVFMFVLIVVFAFLLLIAVRNYLVENREKNKRATELAMANKELVFQNEEKGKLAEELNTANKKLAQFAYAASHDLQEPLRTVANYTRKLETDYLTLLDDNARRYMQRINYALKRMSALIKSILEFSGFGHNIKLTPVDCKKVIDDVIADLESLIKTNDAHIEVAAMPQLNGYETELSRLFQNLLTNAIKFRKKDTDLKIKISSEKINGAWKFSVSDNGIGIAPEHFERVFEVFERLSSKDEYEGSGIGLANCKKIVEMHGGKIWIESNNGHGTIFSFTIPIITI